VDQGLLGDLLEGCRCCFDVRQGREGAGAETAGTALLEDSSQLGRFEAVDGDTEDADTLIRIGGAIDGQAFHSGGLFQKRGAELLFVAAEGFDALFQNKANPFTETGDAEGVVAAGLETVGQEIRLGGDFTFTACSSFP